MYWVSTTYKGLCEGMLEIYKTEHNEESVKIYLHDPNAPFLFEWVKGTKGVNTYYKRDYEKGFASVIDPQGYFSWSYPQGKATIATAKKHIKGKLKEWEY